MISLDNPSGLNVTEGGAPGAVVSADATVTLCLPKQGLRTAEQVGELYLADIGVPPGLWRGIGLEMGPLFAQADVLRIR